MHKQKVKLLIMLTTYNICQYILYTRREEPKYTDIGNGSSYTRVQKLLTRINTTIIVSTTWLTNTRNRAGTVAVIYIMAVFAHSVTAAK